MIPCISRTPLSHVPPNKTDRVGFYEILEYKKYKKNTEHFGHIGLFDALVTFVFRISLYSFDSFIHDDLLIFLFTFHFLIL